MLMQMLAYEPAMPLWMVYGLKGLVLILALLTPIIVLWGGADAFTTAAPPTTTFERFDPASPGFDLIGQPNQADPPAPPTNTGDVRIDIVKAVIIKRPHDTNDQLR